jgi:hypothetical protein
MFRDVVEAVRARSKALRHKFREVGIEISVDTQNGVPIDYVELSFTKSRTQNGPRIRFKLWSDRWAWVDAREYEKKVLKWSFSFDGRLRGNHTGNDLIRDIEEFDKIIVDIDSKDGLDRAKHLWKSVLLKGPSRI